MTADHRRRLQTMNEELAHAAHQIRRARDARDKYSPS
jgi:hypothetical protein